MPAAKPAFPRLNRGHPIANGLLGLWAFGEGSGNRVADLSGQGNDLDTFTGTPSWAGSPFGWALSFPGSSGSNAQGGNLTYLDTNTFTVTAHFSASTYNTGNRAVVSQCVQFPVFNVGGWGVGFRLNNPAVTLCDGTNVIQWSNTDWSSNFLADGQPAMISLAVDRVGQTASVGINGANYVSKSIAALGSMNRGSNRFAVGDVTNGVVGADPAGLVGAVTLHSRILTADELAAISADPFVLCRRRSWRLKVAGGGGVVAHNLTLLGVGG